MNKGYIVSKEKLIEYNHKQREISITNYYNNPNHCLNCNTVIQINDNQRVSQVKKKKFCDHSCAAKYNNKGVRRHGLSPSICLCCGKELIRYGQKFCNYKCYNDFKYKEFIKKWKNSEVDGCRGNYTLSAYIRKYLFDKYHSKCCKCEWSIVSKYTGKIPLEVNHIDGHWKNNNEENLELLCPNCHSLTSTYGSLNRGKGRPYIRTR